MPRYLLRGCTRCQGTLFRDRDGWCCLQCGHRPAPGEAIPRRDAQHRGPRDPESQGRRRLT